MISKIIEMMQQGISYDRIKSVEKTSLDTKYKIKSKEKRKYREKQGWSKNTPDWKYPKWLQDKR